jgi:NAD(P)-dependent dehydrogenase (short-subunit alcohol dehydrogenase family)
MTDFDGKVAVVTGGASGIGRGVAEELLARGAAVVIADIEATALEATAAAIGAVGRRCDVTRIADVRALADEVLRRFGKVDIVCNNAGVGGVAPIADMTLDDWRFVIDVNLWGVIHGVDVFLPHLIANPDGGHLVNTASLVGLAPMAGTNAYAVTKAGVVALSETLALELAQDHPKVGVTVLCPGPVSSNIRRAQRNRPAELPPGGLKELAGQDGPAHLAPRAVGRIVAEAICERRLYAITHPQMRALVEARHVAIAAAHGAYDPPPQGEVADRPEGVEGHGLGLQPPQSLRDSSP